jgi:hypothetical protein
MYPKTKMERKIMSNPSVQMNFVLYYPSIFHDGQKIKRHSVVCTYYCVCILDVDSSSFVQFLKWIASQYHILK